jgi:phosphoribosylamine-glycine ligase
MISALDHKRALDGDRGLNTGGMARLRQIVLFGRDGANCME